MNRTMLKGLRDLLVIAAGTALLALGERATDFGVPVELAPLISTVALTVYRVLRDSTQGAPA
jgi:hypothetical protein